MEIGVQRFAVLLPIEEQQLSVRQDAEDNNGEEDLVPDVSEMTLN